MRITMPATATNIDFGVGCDSTPPRFQDKGMEDMTMRDWYALTFMLQMLNAGAQKGDAPLAQMAVKRAEALLIELERSEP